MSAPIYLDHHATTLRPARSRFDAASLEKEFGNPERAPRFGAKVTVEQARAEVASLVGARTKDVIFTSGATESDNLALQGLLRGRRAHAITQATEHDAVYETLRAMEREGTELTVLPVDSRGLVDPDDLRRALRSDTRLVSIMRVGNEVGSVQRRIQHTWCRSRTRSFTSTPRKGRGSSARRAGARWTSSASRRINLRAQGCGRARRQRARARELRPIVHGQGKRRLPLGDARRRARGLWRCGSADARGRWPRP